MNRIIPVFSPQKIKSILIMGLLLFCFGLNAQNLPPNIDTGNVKNRIYILDNDLGEYIKNDSGSVNKLIGHVKLRHGSDTLYCDSAYFYAGRNSVEAFGNVLVRQAGGEEASADYMRYNGATKVVYMRADLPGSEVQLYDGKENTLWSREVDYNMATKIGKYRTRGYLQTPTTVLESNTGEYNMRSKDARFKGDVVVTDPEYKALSADLGYNTDTKVARFFGPSVVSNDKSILQTTNGVYDTKKRIAHFITRSSILNEAQYIEGDTLDYDRNSGFGFARGNVIAIDTGMKTTLYCGYAQYNEITKTMLAYIKPLMKTLKDGKDSLFVKADTFYSAPVVKSDKILSAQDSLQQTAANLMAESGKETAVHTSDSLALPTKDSSHNADTAMAAANSPLPNLPLPTDTTNTNHPEAPTPKPSVDILKEKMDAMVYGAKDSAGSTSDSSHFANAAADSVGTPFYANDSFYVARTSPHKRALDSASIHYHNMPNDPDTAALRYFVAYNHVVIYSDSLQGRCDSLRYSQSDSMLRMYVQPVLWPQNGQLKGDVIYMQMDSNKLSEIIVPKNAIMVNRSGPEQADMFDQIQGNSIHAWLKDNKIDSLRAEPDASSIYFVTDEDSAYVGSSEGKAESIEVHFKTEQVHRIIYRKEIELKTTPMKDVEPSALRLGRFLWQAAERPKSLAEFLQGVSLPHAPDLLSMPDTEGEPTEPPPAATPETKMQNKSD
ncbi:MAG: OstA-like protein [Edaphocola sp.]